MGKQHYKTMMRESAEKRTVDSKTLAEKESAKADLEKALEEHKEVKKRHHKRANGDSEVHPIVAH